MTKRYKVISAIADLREQPDATALRGKLESQLNYGELFEVSEDHGDWLKGKCAHDGYEGFIEKKHLTSAFNAATHVVTAQRSHVYRDATMKSPILMTLGMGAQVSVVEIGEKFAKLDDGRFIFKDHITPLSAREDFVDAAMRLIETPYVWGGRSGLGTDCSGLVQLALARAGISVTRDTECQENTIGSDATNLPRQRGDIVFFPGHVGIMVDAENMVHANATHMKTVVEPLADALKRSEKITAVRRI
jgi:cell wall-associated NlpC family hydrolase